MRWQGGFPPAPVSTNATAGQRAAPTRRVHRIEGPGQAAAAPDNFQIGLIFYQDKQFQIIDPLAVAGESSLRRSVSRTAAEGRISATRIPVERRDAQRRRRLLRLNPPSQPRGAGSCRAPAPSPARSRLPVCVRVCVCAWVCAQAWVRGCVSAWARRARTCERSLRTRTRAARQPTRSGL